jgi:hypothetical protein
MIFNNIWPPLKIPLVFSVDFREFHFIQLNVLEA